MLPGYRELLESPVQGKHFRHQGLSIQQTLTHCDNMANMCVARGLKLTPKSRSLLYLAHKRCIGTTSAKLENYRYRFAVVGGGCGGTATAARPTEKYGKGNVIVIEPSSVGELADLTPMSLLHHL